jgi:hypothetical protein
MCILSKFSLLVKLKRIKRASILETKLTKKNITNCKPRRSAKGTRLVIINSLF